MSGPLCDFTAFGLLLSDEPVDVAAAPLEARAALLLEAAHGAGPLVASGHLTREHATACLAHYAEQLGLHGENTSADAEGFDALAVIAACLTAASKACGSVPLPDLSDSESWESLHQALLRTTGAAAPAPVREIRPGVRASESFVSITMAQATLAWLARIAPGVPPWMSLVLVLGELEELRAGSHTEIETARRTIRKLRARIAELNDE